MDRLGAGMGLMDLDQELSRADVESVSSDNTVASGTNGNVQVVVRVRPPSTREREQGYIKCVGVDPAAHSVSLNFRPQPRTFTFDYVADESIGQEEIFTSVGKPITDACLQGYHCCLIAYGQTGAGKTFTMEGPDPDSSSAGSPGFLAKASVKRHEKRGLIPRILDYIFQKMSTEKTQNCKDVEFVVKCSYLQIYNEQVSDLLDPGSFNLTIHEDAKTGMYVEGLQEVVVSTAEATYGVFRRGSENRHVGMTAMNLESSRSHSVFTVVVESQRRNDGGVMNRRTSRFYLVDLAGSERQKHSESAGIRLKEAGSINKSLSALGNVIKALVDISEGKIRHVPYRDSKLTFLLKDALGGNSKCTLIANVSPAEKNIDETLSTLKFAQRAKLIHNTAIVNEDMFGNPAVMGEEIRRLRLEIAALRANVGGGLGGEQTPMHSLQPESESARTSRLEHIISQGVKRSLEAERKNEMEAHVLAVKLQATEAKCERLEKNLQSQKMIIRLRENAIERIQSGRPGLLPDEIVQDMREEIEQLRKQIEHHPDVVRFKMELDICRGQLSEYVEERKDEELLSQIGQLENLNQTLRIEFQEMAEEKAKMAKELEEVNSSKDMRMNQLTDFEDQNVVLREAVEKFRKEAAEAVHKQEKAEERLKECQMNENEVWRRSNLVDAQATEYAQELTLLRSQYEKMNGAFNQQTRLQEEIFLELQKSTDELEKSKQTVATLQDDLDETKSIKDRIESQLIQAEEDSAKASRSLEEMVIACEQLATSLKEKDGHHVDLLSKLEQADQNATSLNEKLLEVMSEHMKEKERALEEERRLSAENVEKLRNDMDSEVQQISSILQSKLSQLEEMERLSSEQVRILNEKENLRKAAHEEANKLRQQLEQMTDTVSKLQCDITDRSTTLVSSDAQHTSLLHEKETLESKLIEFEELSMSLNAAKCGREEADRKLSETSALLTETLSNLEVQRAESETLKSAIEEAKQNLLKVNLSFNNLKAEHETLLVENQTIQTELRKKSEELDAVIHDKSGRDVALSEELNKTAAAENHVKELTEEIAKLQADFAAVENLKSDLLEKTNKVELLEQEAGEQLNKVVLSEAAGQKAREDHNQLLTTVKSLEDEKGLLSGKIADLEVASTAMQASNQRLEQEKSSLERNVADLLHENQNAKAEEALLKDMIHAKEEALRINSAQLEDVKSKLAEKLEDLLKLEAELLDQSHQIEAGQKVHAALQNDHSQLVTSAKSWHDEKDSLSKDIAVKEAALKAMEDSLEAINREKAALQASLGSQLEHSDRSAEEQVKDVDTSNHVLNGESPVCVDIAANHNGHVVAENGDEDDVDEFGMKNKYSDQKEHEQETDARLVAALAAVIDLKSHIAGYENKLDLALKSQVQAVEESLVAFLKAQDLESQVALLTEECNKLREELCSNQNRVNTLDSELALCREHGAEYYKDKIRVAEIEKDLEVSRSLVEAITAALDNKASEGTDILKRIEELRSERESLCQELTELQLAKSLADNQLSATEYELAAVSSRCTRLDGEVRVLTIRLDEAVTDSRAKSTILEFQENEMDEMTGKLARACVRLSEEEARVDQSEERTSQLEAQVKTLLAEKLDLRNDQDKVRELSATAKESEFLKEDLEQRFEFLKAEKSQLDNALDVLEVEKEKIRNEVGVLSQQIRASEDQIAHLEAQKRELGQTVESCNSRIHALEALLRETVSDREIQLSVLTSQMRGKEAEFCELGGQNGKLAAELQELRDEIKFHIGEDGIDTRLGTVEPENQTELVQLEAWKVSAGMCGENSKVDGILSNLEGQVSDHGEKVRTWVENFSCLESELCHLRNETTKLEGFDAKVKELEQALQEEQKMRREQKEEILHLQACLTEKAKKTNPFSWSNPVAITAKSEARSLLPGAQSLPRIDAVPKQGFVAKFGAQQSKRMPGLSKDLAGAGGKSKTSSRYASQNKSGGFRPLSEFRPHVSANAQHKSRPQSRTRTAVQVPEKSKKVASSVSQKAAETRQPLRPISNNSNTEDINRRSPVVSKPRYNLRKREKVGDELPTPVPPFRSNKRRRLN